MNVLSLFSGVGGADLGLERAGMEIIGQCEVNASARKILERHWPDVPLSEDITQLDEDWLLSHGIATRNHPAEGKTVDLVVGGFPCQGPDPNPPPDTPRYHQMGNAITVPVAEWIGQRILDQNRKGDQTK